MDVHVMYVVHGLFSTIDFLSMYMYMYSGVRKTSQNTDFGSDTDGALRPNWSSTDHIIKVRQTSLISINHV